MQCNMNMHVRCKLCDHLLRPTLCIKATGTQTHSDTDKTSLWTQRQHRQLLRSAVDGVDKDDRILLATQS